MMDTRQIFEQNPILAIMRNVPLEDTLNYAEAILNGGVKCFEVALNGAHACRQITLLRGEFGGDIVVGAGTAITVERAVNAMEVGAQFLLTPSAQPEILAYCRERGIALLPGALTPTDVALCVTHGFHTMKLFPAGDMPVNYIKSLKGPFDGTDYVAIGGVDCQNIGLFFRNGFLGAGLGSNIMPAEAIASKDWKAGTAWVRKIVEAALDGRAAFEQKKRDKE
ncbi:bifunctional 4-hydroxy-2-oxoglutarate aldolase/2-dehydro-3-deoxy-phosphogluconate aldolase [Enterocloster lavalensis]|uniref:bifunctional 4-hydroxy-2-oxoglutarate aldolase/2-dehydro-3-deoxy-phosphogluconate aldolase n=1 Tax=Enterocloster lavalensis TaxID=460384 RepID=UPI001F32B476|nr:bifunctional 4-hydroxy-2-oxoglutarate aldolase/2-dehydro-3-deoxy-phosphogluconate aldolase [Enterocloster lavalensis]